jgi:uncharacterized cupredoxin-like copper-binding protein
MRAYLMLQGAEDRYRADDSGQAFRGWCAVASLDGLRTNGFRGCARRMRRLSWRAGDQRLRVVPALAGLLTTLLVACGGEGGTTTDVTVSLRQWSVEVSRESAPEGKLRFEVSNQGTVPHEFVVVKSDLPPEGLPVQDGRVVEEQVNLVDEIAPFAAGSVETLELDLSPGKYLLICNIVEQPPGQPVTSHYQNGMVAFFLVEPE